MVNRDIFEKQNTFSMYITTTDECVPKHLKIHLLRLTMKLMMHPLTMYKLPLELLSPMQPHCQYWALLEWDLQKGTICDMFFFLQTTQCHIPNSWFCGRGYNFGYFWRFIKVHQNENHQIWKLLCKFCGQTFNFWSFFEDCKHEKRDDNSFMDTVLLIAHKKKSLLGHLQTKANLNGVKEGALKTFLNCTYPLTSIP